MIHEFIQPVLESIGRAQTEPHAQAAMTLSPSRLSQARQRAMFSLDTPRSPPNVTRTCPYFPFLIVCAVSAPVGLDAI